jgi:hypothetical protein
MEARAGEWSGTTEFGSFTFTVSPDGSAITDFSLNYSAGIASGSVSPQSPVEIPIEEDGSFDLSIPDAGVQFRGQFSEDGTRVSGYWEMDIPLAGTFSEEWELER